MSKYSRECAARTPYTAAAAYEEDLLKPCACVVLNDDNVPKLFDFEIVCERARDKEREREREKRGATDK